MKYMENQETAYEYDFWCAVWLISLAVGRDTIIDRPRAPVFMNWYIILAANSGVTRKSTAVNMASGFAKELLQDDIAANKVGYIEGKSTPENIQLTLHELTSDTGHSTLAIAISELVVFLGREGYTAGMPALLTDLYDSPAHRLGGGTLRHQREYRDTYVSFLSASTPAWLVGRINPDVVEGGFTSRCMFVVSDRRKRRIPWPEGVDDDVGTATIRDLLRSIRARGRSIPSISVNPAALTRFSRWYRRRPENTDAFRSSFESREDAHVLRLAATLSVSDGRWSIEKRDIDVAIKVIHDTKERGADLFDTTGPDRRTKGVERLIRLLQEAGTDGMKQSEITRKLEWFLDVRDRQVTLTILHEAGMVQKFEGVRTTKGSGRPATMWRATRGIVNDALGTVVRHKRFGS
jgi:hypothetical protein